ncbi:predicted protein [Streptomyces lividans TK24]|nr:predicted protein [Streptomyces lividans TK24]
MAVSALTGCTTVRGPAAADPSAVGARSSAPRPDGPAEPRVVQAPAREALEMIGPSPTPEHATGEPRRTKAPAPPPARHRLPAAGATERRPAAPAAPEPTRAPATHRPRGPNCPAGPALAPAGRRTCAPSASNTAAGGRAAPRPASASTRTATEPSRATVTGRAPGRT